MGKSAVIVDRSMMNSKERAADRALGGNPEEATITSGDNAFEDMTDLKNEDFIFVY
jgi:hypothetical protein